MSETNEALLGEHEWESIVDTSYTVVQDMIARSNVFDLTLAKVLNVAQDYQVHQRRKIIKHEFQL